MTLSASVLCAGLAVIAAGLALADEPVSYATGQQLLTKYNCETCHALDKSLAGPSLKDIAKRYSSSPTAITELEAKVLNGSSGAWGGPTPMPGTAVPEADLRPLVEWILSLNDT